MKIQKTSINIATYFFSVVTLEIGSDLKEKLMSQHNSPVS